jgi:hypothetical protein
LFRIPFRLDKTPWAHAALVSNGCSDLCNAAGGRGICVDHGINETFRAGTEACPYAEFVTNRRSDRCNATG